ncbi:MAG TPA: transglycosylase SLT domain-containing protein [Thermoanaerobaculia bacterium]|nr:transglycosylase SLT domain-containing protein [Thermoanaerobaculia bacterium]
MQTPRDVAMSALAFFDAKNYEQAIPALTEAAIRYPEIAPFLRLRVAEAEAARGNVQEAAKVLAEIIALGDSTAATVARLRLPALYARLGDTTSTDAAWQQAMQVPIDELTESDFTALATALAKAERTDLATRTRMRLLNDYTSGRFTEDTYDHLRAEIAKLPEAEQLAIGSKLARANRYDQALEVLNRIGAGPEARATRIRALFNSRNYTTLVEENKLGDLKDPALILLRARAAWRDDRPQEMLAGVERLEKEFPAARETNEARVMRSKYYVTDAVDYAQSIRDLEKAIEAGVVGSDGENIFNLGFTYTLQGKYDEALKVYDRYIRAYPDGDWKTNSLFWSAKHFDTLGRAAERDAMAAAIVAEYPHSSYAYRAKELWPQASGTRRAANNVFPDIQRELSKVTDPRFNTVRALLDVELNRAAAREMKVLATKYADNAGVQYMLADVYVRGGEPFKANGVLQRQFRPFIRHGGDGVPPRFWQILYPLAYWETIQAEAQRRSLDPYLVASVIRQESGFEPATVSNAGAVGLMQIMPNEAARIAQVGGLPETTRQDLFDPLKNIAVGAAEFRQKLDHWKDNQTLAIASYNAGEVAVAGWIERYGLGDIDLFIEAIPYAETRLYVKTVTRNRNEYRRIYERNAGVPAG